MRRLFNKKYCLSIKDWKSIYYIIEDNFKYLPIVFIELERFWNNKSSKYASVLILF